MPTEKDSILRVRLKQRQSDELLEKQKNCGWPIHYEKTEELPEQL